MDAASALAAPPVPGDGPELVVYPAPPINAESPLVSKDFVLADAVLPQRLTLINNILFAHSFRPTELGSWFAHMRYIRQFGEPSDNPTGPTGHN